MGSRGASDVVGRQDQRGRRGGVIGVSAEVALERATSALSE
jgi:hypothetical protein